MVSRKRSLKKSSLYLILDTAVNDYDTLFEIAKRSIKSGVDIVQLRDKSGASKDFLKAAKKLRKISSGKALFIVNDRVDIAVLSNADGVHLGQDDVPIEDARKMLKKGMIVGISCQDLEHAKKAEKSGADYIGFGSVFKTKTKPERDPMNLELLRKVINRINIPVFAIGGINKSNLEKLTCFGCRRVAVCRAICGSGPVESSTLMLKSKLNT